MFSGRLKDVAHKSSLKAKYQMIYWYCCWQALVRHLPALESRLSKILKGLDNACMSALCPCREFYPRTVMGMYIFNLLAMKCILQMVLAVQHPQALFSKQNLRSSIT